MPKVNILIVDDEKDCCHFIQKGLSRDGLAVDVAFDGEEALNKIETNHYDFILLDFHMPQSSGAEVVKAIKEKNVKSVIIMISGYPKEDSFIKEIGADEFLEKPFSFEQVKAIISKYTDKDQAKL